jgi:hypothetical protein
MWNSIQYLMSLLAATLAPLFSQTEPKAMPPCTPSIEPAITVVVSDSRTQKPLEATVVVKDGSFQETLEWNGVTPTGHTIYGGAFERPGRYTITVSRDGYATFVMTGVNVDKDDCHVMTRQLKVNLQPVKPRRESSR